MKFNSRFFAVILTLCMVMNLSVPASAATLDATYEEASYYDVATATYSRLLMFQNGVVPAANADKLYGLIDAAGNTIVDFQYARIWSLGDSIYYGVAKSGEGVGVIDHTGKEIIPCGEYASAEFLGGKYFAVSDGSGRNGIVDFAGKVIREMSSCYITVVDDTIRIMSYIEGSWGEYSYEYFDFSMNPVPAPDSSSSASSGSDFLGGLGWTPPIPPAFLENYDSYEREYMRDFYVVYKGDQTGAVDYDGNVLVPLGVYDEIGGINQSGYIAAVSYDRNPDGTLTNIVSKLFKDGEEVKTFEDKYVATEVYYRNLAFSTTGELNGMMDIDGNILLEEKYVYLEGVYENDAYTGEVKTYTRGENEWGYIFGMYAADGTQIFADEYTQMTYLTGNKYKLHNDEHYGVMTKSGETVIPFNYLDMRVHTLYFIELYDGTYYSIVDVNNKVVVPQSTEEINLFKTTLTLEEALGKASYLAEDYDGYVEDIFPFYYKTAEGYTTVYADYTTGETFGEVKHRASNINENGWFAYQADNGLFGLAHLNKDHTVSFNSHGGTSVAAQYVDHGSKLSKPTDPTKDGHDFGGWYTDTVFDGAYGISVDTEDIFSDVYKWNFDTDVVEGDFTLHAKWTASQNDNDDNQNNDQNNNTNTDNGGGGNGGYDGPVNIPGKKPEQPKPEQPKDEEKPVQTVTFSDVPSGAYYADAVAWAVEKGITNGVGGDSFAPEASCTRGQMVTFLWRMAGCPTVSGGASFSDVTTDSYYADAIAWAVSMGITNGTGDGLFSPDAECSRAQMAVFLFRMVGASAAGGSSFGDVDAGAYYADAVAWAVANGITNGTGDGLFSPSMTCTRGQMVTFLFRCFGAQQ